MKGAAGPVPGGGRMPLLPASGGSLHRSRGRASRCLSCSTSGSSDRSPVAARPGREDLLLNSWLSAASPRGRSPALARPWRQGPGRSGPIYGRAGPSGPCRRTAPAGRAASPADDNACCVPPRPRGAPRRGCWCSTTSTTTEPRGAQRARLPDPPCAAQLGWCCRPGRHAAGPAPAAVLGRDPCDGRPGVHRPRGDDPAGR